MAPFGMPFDLNQSRKSLIAAAAAAYSLDSLIQANQAGSGVSSHHQHLPHHAHLNPHLNPLVQSVLPQTSSGSSHRRETDQSSTSSRSSSSPRSSSHQQYPHAKHHVSTSSPHVKISNEQSSDHLYNSDSNISTGSNKSNNSQREGKNMILLLLLIGTIGLMTTSNSKKEMERSCQSLKEVTQKQQGYSLNH